MKRMLFSLAFLGLTSMGFAQEKGIKFEHWQSWEQVKAKAKAENRYIFMDVFATWCGPCKVMEKEVYPSEKLGTFMNDKFISMKVQANQSKEDTEEIKARYQDSKQILENYHIIGYPSFLFFSPDGKLVNKGIGYKDADILIELSKEALDPEKRYYSKLEKFKQGKLEFMEMPNLALKARSFGDNELSNQIANEYINNYLLKLKETELLTKKNLEFLSAFLEDENSKAFKLFMKQPEKVNLIIGNYGAQNVIMDFINKKYLPQGDPAKSKKPDWDEIEKLVTSKFGGLGQEIVWGQRMAYHWLLHDDWRSFAKYYMLYYDRALRHPRRYDINNITWFGVFQHVDDPAVLDFSINVIEYDLENYDRNNFMVYDTYANLLYKIGRRADALKWEERAVRQSNNDKEITGNLMKMKDNIKTWGGSAN